MLEPVMVFKGGFNCRHSWLPVNPDWDPELKNKVVDEEPTVVPVDAAGNRTITVIAPEGRIDRLKAQIPLQRTGHTRLIDADSNDTGFVAIHENWHNARLDAQAGSRLRSSYDDEYDEAVRRSELGKQVSLRATRKPLSAAERQSLSDYYRSISRPEPAVA